MIEDLDDETLLVVMGDHGMDIKGDHGGESDDEVEAALWMYSKKGLFGRSDKTFVEPPATAKDRPVAQIDLVPTLSLLLGLPIPFNNLGQPIEEAFIGPRGTDYSNLAAVGRLTAAQIHRYQGEYTKARNLDESAISPVVPLWRTALEVWQSVQKTSKPSQEQLKSAYTAFMAYQVENLRICRALWARFDVVSMSMGIIVLVGSVGILALYARGITSDRAAVTPVLLGWGLLGTVLGSALAAVIGSMTSLSFVRTIAFGAGLGGVTGMFLGFWPAREELREPYPHTFWGGLSFLTLLLLCIGFASNSFTIWEDEQLLFFLTTYGVLMLGSSLGLQDPQDRNLGAINAISFLAATRISSFSRLCREEQMPDCRSTYYASASSSTSAAWQLAIPFAVAVVLPSAIIQFYHRTRNYQGSAVIWIGIALRVGLAFVALYWILDAADDGDWYPQISKTLLKSSRVIIAQVTVALAFAAGYATYIFASPPIAVINEPAPAEPSSTSKSVGGDPGAPILTTIDSKPKARSKLIILGYANTHGSRYFLLPCAWLLSLLLVQKPMGQGTLALCFISILNVLEIIDANDLRRSALGPTVLALMGSYYYFKTGHQATLSSIQWDSAFIPLHTIQYPWTPILIALNTFGAQIMCAVAVPAISMWKVKPKLPGLLGKVAGAMATHILFYAAIAVATVIEAAWLRRHLMLYRIFMPRMLMGVTVLLVVEFVGVLVAVMGTRWSIISVTDIFGWV
jgi:phosphatidylinositol glycan class O